MIDQNSVDPVPQWYRSHGCWKVDPMVFFLNFQLISTPKMFSWGNGFFDNIVAFLWTMTLVY